VQRNSPKDKGVREKTMSKYGGKRHFIYLAGAISKDKRTYTWRKIFADLMKHDSVVILDPCDTVYNKRLHSKKNWSLKTVDQSQGRNLLKSKDYKLIEMSSLMIANLDYYTSVKPLIGTVMELEWAFRHFGIPVILICSDPENNPYALHPWVKQQAGAIVETVEDAVDLVREFFL
jgi:nucleoside 2-deoxyribosyltransferase